MPSSLLPPSPTARSGCECSLNHISFTRSCSCIHLFTLFLSLSVVGWPPGPLIRDGPEWIAALTEWCPFTLPALANSVNTSCRGEKRGAEKCKCKPLFIRYVRAKRTVETLKFKVIMMIDAVLALLCSLIQFRM